ncbi:unnamed protein product [marine sediment metagenome]|uniref:SDR family NAD(P)-dependent oxidoreductase n=1 Tax=marine sediment metagenome TaxID=412755 RepID=X1HP24_9ZZZZ
MVKEKLMEKQPFKGKIAVIPGGSKGMGRATAKDFYLLGGSVCIIARGMDALKSAEEEVKKLKTDNSQFVEIISCDTTDMDKLTPLLTDFINKHGIPDYLFNFVGYFYFSEKYYDQFTEEYMEHIKKDLELLAVQNSDPEVKDREYAYINAILPIKALVEIYRRKLKEE